MQITEAEAEALKLCALLAKCIDALPLEEIDKYRAAMDLRAIEQMVVASAAARTMPKIVADEAKAPPKPLTIAEIKARNLEAKGLQFSNELKKQQ